MSTSPQSEHHELDGNFTERNSKRRRTAVYRDAGNQQETGLMRDGDSPGLPRFVGSGSGIHFVRTVYDILARSTGQPSRGESQLVPGEDDQLNGDRNHPGLRDASSPGIGARAPFWRDEEVSSGASTVTFEAMVAWTRNYFSAWHPAFPFLHGPDVLDTFEKVATDGMESLSQPDAAIVRALVSISLADARQLPGAQDSLGPVPSEFLFLNNDHVASCIQFVLGTPASLKNLQAALCVELFLVSMLKFNMASRLGGILVRMAYHLGLHRCPRRYPNFSPYEVSMRKRIWWSFYCLERLVCQALGLPLDVRDDDVDVCLPTSEFHQSSTEDEQPRQDDTQGKGLGVYTVPQSGNLALNNRLAQGRLQVLTLLSKHAQLRGMILELRHKSLHTRQDTIERALDVQSEVSGWANEVHDIAMADQSDAEDGVSNHSSKIGLGPIPPHYQTLLVILQHESTIALNRPLLAKKPATSASQAALQACIHASRTIIETLDDRRVLNPDGLTVDAPSLQAVMTWPLMTWSVWMSCFILTFAALQGVTSPSSASRYCHVPYTCRKMTLLTGA